MQTIYDDGYRVGVETAPSINTSNLGDDGTDLCYEFLQPQYWNGAAVPGSNSVELYDSDDRSMWVTGCVDGLSSGS